MLADLPMSVLAYALAFHYAALSFAWIFVGGTLWWYLLSCVIEHFRGDGPDSVKIRLG